YARPRQALGGGSPGGGRTEQLGEPVARGGVIAAPGGIDHHLGAQRDRLDLQSAAIGGGRGEQHRRARRERDVSGARDRELRLGGHRVLALGRRLAGSGGGAASRVDAPAHDAIPARAAARARSAAKNSGTACSIAPPPEMPSQRDLTRPTSA